MPRPKKPAGTPRAKPPTAREMRDQVDRAEALYVRQVSREKIRRDLCERFALTPGQAEDRIVAAAKRLAADAAADVDRSAKRDRMREAMREVYQRALSVREPLLDAKGDPMLNPTTGEPLYRETPDLRTALRSLVEVSRLDGLYEESDATRSIGDLASLAAAALRKAKASRGET